MRSAPQKAPTLSAQKPPPPPPPPLQVHAGGNGGSVRPAAPLRARLPEDGSGNGIVLLLPKVISLPFSLHYNKQHNNGGLQHAMLVDCVQSENKPDEGDLQSSCITSNVLFLLGGRTGTQRQKTSMARMPADFSWHDSQSASSCSFEAWRCEASRSRRSTLSSIHAVFSREIFLSFLCGAIVGEQLLLYIRHAPSSSSSGSKLYGATQGLA